MDVALLFFLLTFVVGGSLSFIVKKLISHCNELTINKIIVLIIFGLVTISGIAVAIALGVGFFQFGKDAMVDVGFSCDDS